MSKKELDRVEILQKLDAKELKQKQVSELFGLSIRQVQRLLKTYGLNPIKVPKASFLAILTTFFK